MSSSLKSSNRLKNKRRPGDPWISKNRVLNGGTGKSKRNCPVYRNPNFDTDETKLLIQLWGDPKIQRELITTHKKHVVISQLAAKMEEYGFYRSPEEITTRIKNMKCFYNRLKRELETSKSPSLDPSWRHYAEMDAIMTRPIFSVRPNEVPAPSLKYLLEQEQEKRKERKRKAEEDGDTISDSDEDISDILAVPSSGAANVTSDSHSQLSDEPDDYTEPDAEIEFEVDEKTLAALENVTNGSDKTTKEDSKKTKTHQSMSDAELAIKLEIESEEFQDYNENETNDKAAKPLSPNKTSAKAKTISISFDEDLLIPKVEPIDVEEAYANIQKQQQSPTPTQNPKTSTHLADILKQPTKTTTQAVIKFSLPNNSMTTAISSANTAIQTQSKISVVSPTILMPQPMSTKSSADSTMSALRQVRLGGNIHALLAASGSRATVTNANGMKFLLVNTADQRGPPITTSTVSSTLATNINAPNNQTTMQILQKPAQFQQQQQQQQQQHQQQQKSQPQQQQQQHNKPQISLLKPKETLKRQEYKEQLKKRELSGIKSTLLKLLKVQEDANEIQNQRLAIERERLQFERTMAEKFLNIFEQRPTTMPKVFTTNSTQNVTSTGQMMLPPKLLITTMVPTSAAQSAAGGSSLPVTSNVLTSTGFTNRAAKQNNEIQLLVPKEEPHN